MAIKADYNFRGYILSSAYVKIALVEYSKMGQAANPETGAIEPLNPYLLNFVAEILAVQDSPVIDTRRYQMPLDITNQKLWIQQAYDFLKTMPEYAGAIDA